MNGGETMDKRTALHFQRAKDYIAKGEKFYRQAGLEMQKARDLGATWVAIGDALGRSDEWCKRVTAWAKSPANQNKSTLPFSEEQGAVAQRHTKSVLRQAPEETLVEIMRDLPVERRAAVVRAAVPPPERVAPTRAEKTFIDLIVRINSALIELEAMVGAWQNTSGVPAEFSRESFNDIAAKVRRIQKAFAAIEMDDDDEFQRIVRNFRVTSDVR